MLSGLHDPAQRAWLVALLGVWAALLFGGFAFGRTNAEGTGRIPTWARLGSSLTLAIAAWSWFAFTRLSSVSTYSLLLALGMTLGCLGDILLAEILTFKGIEPIGIAAFGVGHVCYIAAILSFANAHGLDAAAPRWIAEALGLLLGLGGWYFAVYRGSAARTALHWLALPYALLLASTFGFAAGLAVQAPTFVPLAIGAALFLASDLVLAAGMFTGRTFPHMRDVIWLTYGPAQALIVYSVNAALLATGHSAS